MYELSSLGSIGNILQLENVLAECCRRRVDGRRQSQVSDLLAQRRDLADLLEKEHLPRFVTIYADTSGVIASVFLPSKTVDEDFTDGFTVLTEAR